MAKICIDAGHYGKYNRSPGVPEYYESEMTWKLSMLQKKYLEQMGHTVVLTRTNKDKDLELTSRGKASKGCDLFISNHSNAVGSNMNETVKYVSVYHLVDDKTTKCDDISAAIAKKIAPVIAETMSTTYKVMTRKSSNDRNKDGFLNDNYYGVLHGARLVNTPGLILEHGFHTNTNTVKWLLNDSNLDRLAKAEAECINSHFGGTVKDDSKLTKIAGKSVATIDQMKSYIKSKNPNVTQSVLDMISLYISEGEAEGIRGDIAFAQSCIETGNFTFGGGTAVTLDQNNFSGLGVTRMGLKGNSYPTPQMGIRAQIQHLKAYANTEALKNECIDVRFKYVQRGCAEYVEWLGIPDNPNGKGWAAGTGYGSKILKILNNIIETTAENESVKPTTPISFNPYTVRVSRNDLNIRKGPGTNYGKVELIKPGVYTIVDVKTGTGSKTGWGKLKSGAGWISLDYVTKI